MNLPELAVCFTDKAKYFVSEASVYRLLKAHDLIATPAFIVMKAAEEFKDKTTAPNQLWQTDFTYLKVASWGWFYLSTVLDDFSRYIIAWKLCATMKADDVIATLDLALAASGLDRATVIHRPRLLTDNGASYIATDLAKWLDGQGMEHVRSTPYHPRTQGKIDRWHQTLKNHILLENYYLPGDLEREIKAFTAYYNHRRYHERIANLTPGRRLPWARPEYPPRTRKDQTTDDRKSPLAGLAASGRYCDIRPPDAATQNERDPAERQLIIRGKLFKQPGLWTRIQAAIFRQLSAQRRQASAQSFISPIRSQSAAQCAQISAQKRQVRL
jgi:transposase InsO family protein